jgi:hypothetical protein
LELIGERFNDTWIDGVKLNVKKLLIYLIKHYGLAEKAPTTGCEIGIIADGAKLDAYCIHITSGFKMMDKDARDPLEIETNDPLERGKLLFETMQSEKKLVPNCVTHSKR